MLPFLLQPAEKQKMSIHRLAVPGLLRRMAIGISSAAAWNAAADVVTGTKSGTFGKPSLADDSPFGPYPRGL